MAKTLTPEVLKNDAELALAFLSALHERLPELSPEDVVPLLESAVKVPAVLALLHGRLAGK